MIKKIATGISALALIAALASCSTEEKLQEVDVNGLTISAACEKVREAGWRVEQVRGTENRQESSDCTDSERKVAKSWFSSDTVTLYFANDPVTPSEEAPIEESSIEESPVEEAPAAEPIVEEDSSVGSTRSYQAIYDEYSARLQNECPNLSMTECAELSNEGVTEMARYMYTAKGKDGQYDTYEEWSQKLYDVYMSSVQF